MKGGFPWLRQLEPYLPPRHISAHALIGPFAASPPQRKRGLRGCRLAVIPGGREPERREIERDRVEGGGRDLVVSARREPQDPALPARLEGLEHARLWIDRPEMSDAVVAIEISLPSAEQARACRLRSRG